MVTLLEGDLNARVVLSENCNPANCPEQSMAILSPDP